MVVCLGGWCSFVAHRLFLNRRPSAGDMSVHLELQCVSVCVWIRRQVASPTSSRQSFSTKNHYLYSILGMWCYVNVDQPPHAELRLWATSCLQQTRGCVHGVKENYCVAKTTRFFFSHCHFCSCHTCTIFMCFYKVTQSVDYKLISAVLKVMFLWISIKVSINT